MRVATWILVAVVAAACGDEGELTPDAGTSPPPAPVPSGELRGRVVVEDAAGARTPAPFLLLLLEPGEHAILTDAEGRFVVTGLSSGRHLLHGELDVDADGRVDLGFHRRDIVLAANAGLDLGDVVAAGLGDVEGRVLRDAVPQPGAFVVLTPDGAARPAERVVATDADGAFRFRGLIPGSYTLRALLVGPPSFGVEQDVEVPASAIGRADVMLANLPAEQATVRGTATGSDAAGLEITLVAADGTTSADVASGGAFAMQVSPGLYTARATIDADDTVPATVPTLLVFGDVDLGALVVRVEPASVRDLDRDGVVASADTDDDGDGCLDASEPVATRRDARSCTDLDADGFGDGIDVDDDGDAIADPLDGCATRFDPPGLARPQGCAPYPSLTAWLEAPSSVRVDEGFLARLHVEGGVGEAEVALTFTGPEEAEGTAFERESGIWQLEAETPGTWSVRATISDDVQVHVVEAVVIVEAPPIDVVVVPPTAVEPGAEVVLSAVLHEPLTGAVFDWQEIDGDLVDIVAGSDTPAVTLHARVAGTARFSVHVTKGARSGEASVELVVRAVPIPVSLPARIETTVGEPVAASAQLGEELSDVTWEWSGENALQVTGTGASVQVVATGAGDHVLRAVAKTSQRQGETGTVVRAHPIGVVSFDGPAGQSVGFSRTYPITITPAMREPVVTYALHAGASAGAEVSPAGTSFEFRASALGTWLVDVEAREGVRVARGTITVSVDSEPLAVTVARTPQPIAYAGTEVVLTASSAGLSDPAQASWSWTARGNNPAQPALTGATTHELRFLPPVAGTYRFDLSVRAGPRGATVPVEVVVESRDAIGVSAWWYGNRVGKLLELDSEIRKWSEDAVWTWTQDPGNPAQLTLRRPTESKAVASVTVPGLYRFTVHVTSQGRTGSKTVEVEVLAADEPRPELTIYGWDATFVLGEELGLSLDSNQNVDIASTVWSADPANPAPAEIAWEEPWEVEFVPTVAGTYRFRADVTTSAGETSHVVIDVLVVPQLRVDAGLVATAVAGGPIKLGATSDTTDSVEWSWFSLQRPSGAPSVSFVNRNLASVSTSNAAVVGQYRFEVSATSYSSYGSAVVVVDVQPAAGTMSFELPSTLRGAVGRPVRARVVQRNALDPTFTWTQAATDPIRVDLAGASAAEMSFVPAQVGTYHFDVTARDFSGTSISGQVTVVVDQVLPELRIDGAASLPPVPVLNSAQRLWLCDSPRNDVVSYTWERASGAIDGEVVIDGPWIAFRLASSAHPISAWRCTARTSSGATFSVVRPLVVTLNQFLNNEVVRFARLSSGPLPDCTRRPLPSGCLGTFDDPYPTLARALQDYPTTLVALAGEESSTVPLATSNTNILGGVDPTTFEMAPARHPSVLRFTDVDTTAVLLASNGTRLEGFEVHVAPKATSTAEITVIEAANASIVSRNSIEVVAGTQAVTAIRTSTGGNPSLAQVTQNRVRIVGGSGSGAIVDRCRGSLVAHNAVEVDATSALAAGLRVDCSGTHVRKPMFVANNVVFMGSANAGYAVDGAPATDAGHRFAGNWFSGTGPFVTASLLSPARSLTTPAQINAGFAAGGLDGGGNTNDSACFSPSGTSRWANGVNPGSSCAGAAVRPKPATLTTPELLSLSADADGTIRALATGWAAPDGNGTLDIGPDEK